MVSPRQYQLLIEYDFNGLTNIPPFTTTLTLNPAYNQYFSSSDLSQCVTLPIDPAQLSVVQPVNSLKLSQISRGSMALNNHSTLSDSDINNLFDD